MTAQEVASYIYKELRKAGATNAGACAVLGNIEAESRFIPNNVEDSFKQFTDEFYTMHVDNRSYTNFVYDGVGYGIAQWTQHSRKKKLLTYIQQHGYSIGSLQGQVEFLIKEFKEDFPNIWKNVCSCEDLYTMTSQLLNDWENPEVKNLSERYSYALKWLSQLAQGGNNNMTKNEAIEKILDLARDEIGYHEKISNSQLDDKYANAGGGNYTKYARDLDNVTNFYNGKKNGFAWCDIFVDWLFYKTFGAATAMKMLYQPSSSAGAGCAYSAQYFKSAGRWYTTPEPGDQIFFYSSGQINHTGIVESISGSQVNTIEGNTADQVARRTYSLYNTLIAGFGRPNWATAEGGSTPSDDSSSYTTVLRYGMRGIKIKEFQQKLITLGYSLGADGADGDFGANTLIAVKKFQGEHGLVADGEVGPQTQKKLDEAIAAMNQTTPGDNSATDFKVGDIVMFVGNRHYLAATADIGFDCKPGKARISMIYSFPNVKHPYHLIKVAGSESNVFGWVNKNDLQKI